MQKEEQILLDFEDRERAIDQLFHPTSAKDTYCPFIEWMGEDLIHCPGVGEWKCHLQSFQYGEYNQNTDYKDCGFPSHKSCPHYLAQQK